MIESSRKNLLVFGYGVALLIPAIVFWRGRHGGLGLLSYVFLFLAGVILLITIMRYESLKPFYEIWMKCAMLIGNTISKIVMILMFCFIFTPVGLVLRILGKDLLDQKSNRQSPTYWITYDDEEFNPLRCKDQF